MLSSMSN